LAQSYFKPVIRVVSSMTSHLLHQSVPVPFRICINLVQITWSSAFCQSVKLAHNSSSTRCYQNVPEMYQEESKHTQSHNHHHSLQSSPLGCIHNDPNIVAMIRSFLGSAFMSAFSAPVILFGSPRWF
jgi:hypothetical protein